MGNYHARCGAGEKPEVATPEAYLSLFGIVPDLCDSFVTEKVTHKSAFVKRRFGELIFR